MRTVSIDTSKIIGTPNPKMWGIFYEEINHAGEGGLYAELIRNRNFAESNPPENTRYINKKVTNKGEIQQGYYQTPEGFSELMDLSDPLPGWSVKSEICATASVSRTTDNPRNPECPEQLKCMCDGKTKIINGGYWGINAKKQSYNGFIIVRSKEIESVTVGLMRKDGTVIGSSEIKGINAEFKKFEFTFECKQPNENARFFIETSSGGILFVDFVSLFPEDTYNGEKNGFRKDILQFLKDMKPGFLRFPGGCVVEGVTLENAIHWKKTIGPIEDRPGHWNLWNYRFTDGLGMLEYCKLGEILDADLMYVFNCGISCQARRGKAHGEEATNFWLQNALDGIEFICGDKTTKWGAVRAELGHPEPFNLKYVEIGNENSGDDYKKSYALFRKAIREKYPNLLIISNTRIEGEDYDLVDDHYYTEPTFFPNACTKYDGNDEEKIYVGEYACNSQVGYGNLMSAISEACFMTHMENRSDRVRIASYAPLFCNDNDRRWSVNLINFDRTRVFGIPSYYVQKLFSENSVDNVVYTDCKPSTNENLFVTAGKKNGNLVIKAVNFSDKPEKVTFVSSDIKKGIKELNLVTSENPEDTNSLLYRENVATTVTELACEDGKAELVLPAYSFVVIK